MNNTHMRHIALAVLSACLVASSCTKDDELLGAGADRPPALNLLDPAVGQQAAYQRISLAATDSSAYAHPDTLLLTVTAVQSDGTLLVEESLTAHSQARLTGRGVGYPQQALNIEFSPKPAELHVLGDSRLVPTFTEGRQDLSYLASDGRISLQGDRLEADYLPLRRTLALDGQSWIADLHHEYRDDGLPGLTFVHDRQLGVVLALTEYNLAGNAEGWRLIQ